MKRYKALDLTDTVMGRLDDDAEGTDHFPWEGIEITVWAVNGIIRKIRITSELGNPYAEELRELAYETVCTLLSETTNNDACDVTVRERSGHLQDHADLPDEVKRDNFAYVVVDAEILDELS